MLYYKYNAEDVKSHKSFCSMFIEGVQCPSFKYFWVILRLDMLFRNTSILTVFEDLPSSTLILAIPSVFRAVPT